MSRLPLPTPRLPGPGRVAGSRVRATVAAVTALAVAAALLVVGVHETFPATRLPVESGQVWVSSEQIGALTLLDGISGRAEASIPVARHVGDPLAAGQSAALGFALDQQAGTVTVVDTATLAAASVTESMGAPGDQDQLYVGAHTLYVVDGVNGEVTSYDAATLQELGAPAQFASGSGPYSAVVDSADRLWVLDGVDGTLSWFRGSAHAEHVGVAPIGSTVTAVGGAAIVVEPSAERAYLLGPGGALGRDVDLGPAGGVGTLATGAAATPDLLVLAASGTVYETCGFAAGSCGAPVRIPATGEALGPAVAADGRVFVPDYSDGCVWVLDPAGPSAPRHVRVLPGPARFDLLAANGLVFFNDPHSNAAGTIAADGAVHAILKYSAAEPASPAPVSPTAIPPSAFRTTPPTPSAVPTGPAATAAAPSRTAAPGPTQVAPSGFPSPTPSPSPSPTGKEAIPCGTRLTASVLLTQDMHCAGDALVIAADGVTVDLGGYSVTGSGSGAGVTLAGGGGPIADAVVEDGTVSGFGDGVLVGPDGADDPQIDRVTFAADGSGGAAVEIGTATVAGLGLDDVIVQDSRGPGLESTGVLSGSLVVDNSTFSGASFTVDELGDVDVTPGLHGDTFESSALTFEYVGLATIDDSTFDGSPVLDMCHEDGDDTFDGDSFTGTSTGLEIEGMADEHIQDDTFKDDTVGLYLKLREGDTGTTVSQNTFADDTAAGILLDDSATDGASLMISDNTLSHNGYGGGVADAGGNPVADAIHLYAPGGGVDVSGNNTSGDAAYGIWSVEGTSSGSGNVSTGDKDGCDPTTLCTYG